MRATVFLLALVSATPVVADTIVLLDGRVIQADRAWYEGSEVRYEKDGLTAGVPRRLVKTVDQKTPPAETTDPRVLSARRALAAGYAAAAAKALEAVPANEMKLPALETLAEAYLKLNDARKARDTIDRALHLDDRCARCLALRGDALMAMGDHAGAQDSYQRSLLLRADSDVERKLAAAAPTQAPTLPPPSQTGAQFRLQYDGGINEPLGVAVLDILNEAYAEYSKRLGSRPEKPITVLLQTGTDFHEDTRTPEWAEGLNDGTIRVPLRGVDKPSPHLTAVLRHELAHSFVADRTGGNCPTWLQEGIAQWLEGGDPARDDARVAGFAREHHMHPLVTLEGPFTNLPESEAATAYEESLSALAHILRKRGEPGVVRLLAALADGVASEEALPVALALSYPEFQKSWEEYLLKMPAAAATPTASR